MWLSLEILATTLWKLRMFGNITSICWQGWRYHSNGPRTNGEYLCAGESCSTSCEKSFALSCNLKWIDTGRMFSLCTTAEHIILCCHWSDSLHSATRFFRVVYRQHELLTVMCKKAKAYQDFLDFLVCVRRKLDGKRHQNGSCKGFLIFVD